MKKEMDLNEFCQELMNELLDYTNEREVGRIYFDLEKRHLNDPELKIKVLVRTLCLSLFNYENMANNYLALAHKQSEIIKNMTIKIGKL